MKITCLHLAQVEKQAQLYVAEISTAEALKIFSSSESIKVTEFEAQVDKGAGWVSKKDLPAIKNVGDLINYLGSSEKLELIDFRGAIGSNTELSTHDDGEATYLVNNETAAIDLLRRIIDAGLFEAASATLVANKGKYLYPTNEKIEISDAFIGWDLSGL